MAYLKGCPKCNYAGKLGTVPVTPAKNVKPNGVVTSLAAVAAQIADQPNMAITMMSQ